MKKNVAVFFLLLFVLATAFYGCSTADVIASKAYEAAESSEDFFVPAMNKSRDYLRIVNEKQPYTFDSSYDKSLQQDLVYVADDLTGDITRVERAAYYAFSKMKFDLEQKGVKIGLYAAHTTKEDQKSIYDYYSNLEGWSESNKTMPPGLSENHTGLLLNILVWFSEDGENYAWYTESAERQMKFPYFKQVHEALADYGFIDRYPAGKESITGIPNEPYLIRFVGSTKIAHEIMDGSLCLEEYVKSK